MPCASAAGTSPGGRLTPSTLIVPRFADWGERLASAGVAVVFPDSFTTRNLANQCRVRERKVLSFVLAQPEPGLSAQEVCRRIEQQTSFQALTQDDFFWKTVDYFLSSTGIPA